ncbi:unnamed protein product [Rhizoctonia solani]|uniref:Uncharacterized protein n=1 Tax=Rhizoctonia solani TaxID=456999 RepID=A0A8H3C4Q2_9AGAM|nr:unnamed protein product [Rhizoctonia solani]
MNGNMDNIFVRAGRSLRLHFDNTRITALATRQLSWRVEQAGGAIVDQPSSADVLVVDPAAAWVFHDFLRTKRPELRPSVVLAFWIPLCLTTRNLIWVNHAYWEQVVIPSERPPRSEIPQGITAYSSFLAGITYAKNPPFSSTGSTSLSLMTRERDSSIISHLDNSDIEVSQSLEPGPSSDEESLGAARKSSRSVASRKKTGSISPSTNASPERPTEEDEADVSATIPTDDSLRLEDANMSPPSPILEPIEEPPMESVLGNVASPNSSVLPSRSPKRQSPIIPEPSSAQRSSSPHPSLSQNGATQSSTDSSLTQATVTVEPDTFFESSSIQLTEAEPTVPPHPVTKSTSPKPPETVVNSKGAYVPPTLGSTPPPVSEHPNSAPPEPSPRVPKVLTEDRSPDGAAPNVPSGERSGVTIVTEPSNTPNGSSITRVQPSVEADTSSQPAESTTSVASPAETPSTKPRASTSDAPPNTPASTLKNSVVQSVATSSTGLKYIPEHLSGTQSSKSSPPNAPRLKVKPKMRPTPHEENDSAVSGSSPRTSLPKSKLNIQSVSNGTSAKPRPSVFASLTGGTPPIKSSQSSGRAHSPESSASSLPGSSTTTPATTVAADTPNAAPGFTISRPKKLIVRGPTISTTSPAQQHASMSPVLTRHLVPSSSPEPSSSSPDVSGRGPPPIPPTPTPEQKAALDAKRPAWTKEEDRYIIDYMNWVFAQDPLASTSEIMREIAANCPYRPAGNWHKRFASKEDSIYMNEVPILFERLTNKTSGASTSRGGNKSLEILSGTRTRNRRTVDYVNSSEDENGSNDGCGPPRKKSRHSRSSVRRRSDRLP